MDKKISLFGLENVARRCLQTLLACLLLSSPASDVLAAKKGKDKKDKKDKKNELCPANIPPVPDVDRKDVYKNVPYKQGEIAKYKVSYMGALAGTGVMEVRPPFKYQGQYAKPVWHQNFHAEAKTGDWFKLIFVTHDRIDSYVRSWDHGISKFYMEQDEGKLFSSRFQQKKWLEFDQENCRVKEKIERVGKPNKTVEVDLAYGAMDTLGIVYWLRTQKFEVGKLVRGLTYSSEKNWWLEANPMAIEEIKVGAGVFKKCVKLKLQTYIGQDLQQKGDVVAWIDTESPAHPLVLVKGEIKIGSLWIELDEFKPGI